MLQLNMQFNHRRSCIPRLSFNSAKRSTALVARSREITAEKRPCGTVSKIRGKYEYFYRIAPSVQMLVQEQAIGVSRETS